jgi:solute carrier family 35 protein F1/2
MQNNFLYFLLFVTYTPYTIYKYGFKGWGKLLLRDGWKYVILAASDVEGNFLVVKAYSYTDLLSCMLLDAWAIPICLLFSWIYMRIKYRWAQLLGILICVGGLGALVRSDLNTGKNWQAVSKGKGDAFMIAGSTLYGFTNATEEFFVRKRPLYEVVGLLGMFGFIINGIQASALEHTLIKNGNWNGTTGGLLVAYTSAMFILYSVAPLLYRSASSAYFNLSLLSSDFYGLLFGLFLFHYRPYWLYFVSYAVVIIGLVIYFWSSAPEEQGVLSPQAPDYIKSVRGIPTEQHGSDKDGEEFVVPSLLKV